MDKLSMKEDVVMKIIETTSQLLDNIETLQRYLDTKTEPTYDFALNLVKYGVCFVTVRKSDGYRFYPSRFLGYINNTMSDHQSNNQKDGRETNPAITRILNAKPVCDSLLEKEYRKYCERLGFIANDKGRFGKERKFWTV